MGLFDFLQKKKNIFSSSDQNALSEFTDSELKFLAYSAGHDTDIHSFSKHFFYQYNLNYKKTIKKLLDANLLIIGTAEDSLNIYTVKELKDYLKQQDISTTGKKDILIEKIISQTTEYADFFTKRTYSLTSEGKLMVDDYNNRKAKQMQHNVFATISSMRSGDLNAIYSLYGIKNPLAIPYDKESIKKDIDAINHYRCLDHDTDRELAACIVSIMMHQGIKNSIDAMKILGYEDACESEIYTAFSSITSLRSINEYRDSHIQKI